MKKTFGALPELFFMGMGLFWIAERYFTLGSVNYFALLITWLLFLQFFYKNRLAGLVYGLGLGSFSVYRLISVISGYFHGSEAEVFTQSVVFSTVLYGMALVMASVMVYKYVTSKVRYDESVLTITF
ncbi:hypothetical protein R1T16_05465 [Flavobacterium sp. DG1-102-2]|uniref:hypothetical protein n=1 Tax=Flavobacterium sp. DG1-102-2 TaxID=3081663 RepID=UPI002949F045|nr:hypothetical protein [Flavobacterium sp. DG1-102-2]MDV6167863.1 hypothetical protein [Flavobacterium sp. DG1-102-2]